MFSDNSIRTILKKAGALKINKDAIEKLKIITEKNSLIIARKAVKNAEYSGRKVIKSEDIKEAVKEE